MGKKPAKANRSTITRATLACYAGMLGRDSVAAAALKAYDAERAAGRHPRITMPNNGFVLEVDGRRERFGA
jgi:hypothetical protein